jgi:hypothetical protein
VVIGKKKSQKKRKLPTPAELVKAETLKEKEQKNWVVNKEKGCLLTYSFF